MDHLEEKTSGKREQRVWQEEEPAISNVDKIRGYYDEARNRLKNYLAAMGSGSSSPKGLDVGVDGEGGAVFQQRPAHCRLEGKTQVDSSEEFTDISYSDLGFIITPQSKKLTINNNNNYQNCPDSSLDLSHSPPSASPTPSTKVVYEDHDCDIVSSEVEGGNMRSSGTSSTTTTNSSNNNSNNSLPGATLQHRSSNSSFTKSQLPGAAAHGPPTPKNLDDLRLEEILS